MDTVQNVCLVAMLNNNKDLEKDKWKMEERNR